MFNLIKLNAKSSNKVRHGNPLLVLPMMSQVIFNVARLCYQESRSEVKLDWDLISRSNYVRIHLVMVYE